MASRLALKPTEQIITLAFSKYVPWNAPVSDESVFSDSRWKMRDSVKLLGVSESDTDINFESLPGFPGGFALSIAEFAYARHFKPVPNCDQDVCWLTVTNEIASLRQFAQFCVGEGLTSFAEVNVEICRIYLLRINHGTEDEMKKSEERVRTLIRHVYLLWDFSSVITEPIPVMPFGKRYTRLFKKGSSNRDRSENATPPIPEAIFGPLMSNAIDCVAAYGEALIDTWNIARAVQSMINSMERRSRRETQTFFNRELAKALAKKTSSSSAKVAWKGIRQLYRDLHALRTACMLVILAFSGIRASEVLSLEAGCCRHEKGDDGRYRYYIDAILFKDRGQGTLETWVVIEDVAKAVSILELLTEPMRRATGDQRLTVTDGSSHFFFLDKNYRKQELSEPTFEALIYQQNSFRDYCNRQKKFAPIPNWPDKNGILEPWSFHSRQFRRTLARHIARQPFGVIAGMLQYKHVAVTLFEGYAGTDPDWNKLLEEEKIISSVNILDELAIDMSCGAVTGKLGDRLKAEFELEFRGRADDFPPSQIAKWLANSEKALYVGKFNFCFFDPAKSLCTQDMPGSKQPNLNFCQPSHCNNACVAKRHIPLWKAQLEQAEQMANLQNISEFQKNALGEEIDQLHSVVDNFPKE